MTVDTVVAVPKADLRLIYANLNGAAEVARNTAKTLANLQSEIARQLTEARTALSTIESQAARIQTLLEQAEGA